MPETHKESRTPEWIKAQPGHILGHFIYDFIKENLRPFGFAAMLTGIAALVTRIRQHLDVIGIVSIFVFAVLMFVLDARIAKRRRRESSIGVSQSLEHPEQFKKPEIEPSPSKIGKFRKPNWGAPPRDTATDANGNMIRAGDLVTIPAWVKKVTWTGTADQLEVYTAYLLPDHLMNPSHAEGSRLNLIANQVEKIDEDQQQPSAKTFSSPNVLILPGLHITIFPANPGVHGSPALWVTPIRSEAEIQITILSTDTIELQYVKADIIRNNDNVTTLERNESVLIPALNPRAETIKRNLTPNELQRFGDDRTTWFQIHGVAKFKGPKGEELKVNFEFGTTAWRYGQPG